MYSYLISLFCIPFSTPYFTQLFPLLNLYSLLVLLFYIPIYISLFYVPILSPCFIFLSPHLIYMVKMRVETCKTDNTLLAVKFMGGTCGGTIPREATGCFMFEQWHLQAGSQVEQSPLALTLAQFLHFPSSLQQQQATILVNFTLIYNRSGYVHNFTFGI